MNEQVGEFSVEPCTFGPASEFHGWRVVRPGDPIVQVYHDYASASAEASRRNAETMRHRATPPESP